MIFDLRELRVLLLDDDVDGREAISVALSQRGARVTQASTVAEALECVAKDVPDAIVSDIALPVEDGYSFISKLRAGESAAVREVPVIAVTAYGSAEDRRRILAAGFDAQIPKPIEPRVLSATVKRLAQRTSRAARDH